MDKKTRIFSYTFYKMYNYYVSLPKNFLHIKREKEQHRFFNYIFTQHLLV